MLRLVAILAFPALVFAQIPTVSSVVNIANSAVALCPGMVATVSGSNFGSNGALISVEVGGVPAYVYASYVTSTQFQVEIPYELTAGPTTLTVTVGSISSAPFQHHTYEICSQHRDADRPPVRGLPAPTSTPLQGTPLLH